MMSENILDNLKEIKQLDKDNMLDHLYAFPDYCENAFKIAMKSPLPSKLHNLRGIIIAGMGGSAIGGDILTNWLEDSCKFPIVVVRDYCLPAYVNDEFLVIAVSYSGNTEETLSCYLDSIERQCSVIAVTSDGYLAEFSDRLDKPLVRIPRGIPPRAAFPYLFFSLLAIVAKLEIIENNKTWSEVKQCIADLRELRKEIEPNVPLEHNIAKQISCKLYDKFPIIYGARSIGGVLLRFKNQLNENSKILAICNVLPELGHNEVVGFENGLSNLSVVILRTKNESETIKACIEGLKDYLSRKNIGDIIELFSYGDSKLSQLVSLIYLGDYISVYLALKKRVNPTPIKAVDDMRVFIRERCDIIPHITKRFEKLKHLT